MNEPLHPIAHAIHDLAHIYVQCDRLLERLGELLIRPTGQPGLLALPSLCRPEKFALEDIWIQDQLESALGFSFALIPSKQGATKPKGQLFFIIVLAPASLDVLDPLSPREPYLMTYLHRADVLEAGTDCFELTKAGNWADGLRGGTPWLLCSADLTSTRWHAQPNESWWAFATCLTELRDDRSLMQRVVAPCLRLLDKFDVDMTAPAGAFHFEQDAAGWHCAQHTPVA